MTITINHPGTQRNNNWLIGVSIAVIAAVLLAFVVQITASDTNSPAPATSVDSVVNDAPVQATRGLGHPTAALGQATTAFNPPTAGLGHPTAGLGQATGGAAAANGGAAAAVTQQNDAFFLGINDADPQQAVGTVATNTSEFGPIVYGLPSDPWNSPTVESQELPHRSNFASDADWLAAINE